VQTSSSSTSASITSLLYFLLRGLRLLPLRRRLLRLLLPGVPLIICIFVRGSDRHV
jgi:hypothetical protein